MATALKKKTAKKKVTTKQQRAARAKKAAKAPVKKKPASKPGKVLEYDEQFWPLAKITDELNPRKVFDQDQIEKLAATFGEVGLVEPLVGRPHPTKKETVQLLSGGRRLRAAKVAGLKVIPVRVCQVDDHEAKQIALVSNLQRADMTAIEEAAALEQLCTTRTQDDVAAEIGKTQAYVANRIRLLKLPEAWQQKIISGEITPTQGRTLASYAEHKEILASIGKELDRCYKYGATKGEPLDSDYFRETLVQGVYDGGRELADKRYGSGFTSHGIGKISDEEREQLRVVEVTDPANSKKKLEMCLNVKLWDKLHAREGKRLAKGGKADTNGKSKPKQKLTAKEQAAKDKKLAEQFQNRLYQVRLDWLRYVLYKSLGDDVTDWAAVMKTVF
ncbi:MAG: ParB/RepB/Spo0J family partition protein [Pirellulales bacterium]|nr:ParB/RepB/Spo0J family partition protein [Pirellulales bacterium]